MYSTNMDLEIIGYRIEAFKDSVQRVDRRASMTQAAKPGTPTRKLALRRADPRSEPEQCTGYASCCAQA